MNTYWIKAEIIECNHRILAKCDQLEEVVFHTDKKYSFVKGDIVEILTDDIMTLSLPPQRKAYEIHLIKKGKNTMRFNLVEMKEKFKGQFTKKDLEELEAIENQLHFNEFNSEVALKLGNALYNKAKPRGAVAIRITRESDQLPIFQIIMDGKTQRHLNFGEAKRQTVLQTGHCSMWALVKEIADGGLDELFIEDSPCLTGSGGFPIYVKDEMVATVFVSGLHEGQDQLVLVEALSEVLNVEVSEYHGLIF